MTYGLEGPLRYVCSPYMQERKSGVREVRNKTSWVFRDGTSETLVKLQIKDGC